VRDVAYRTTLDLAGAIRRRELGSRELLEHLLARVERLNPKLNAAITLDADRARQRADEADRALARGEARGPLHGLPMTIKDTFETAGMRTTAGAPSLSSHVPSDDATAVVRLVAARAIVFGKTNVPLFAGDLQSYNAIFGATNNPWDVARSPGGSSGGAAAALAAGLTPLELGSDLGGSIRNPAHYCGVYGHKPTYGLIPMRGHIPGPPGTLADADLGVAGPLARDAADLEAALDVLAGPDEARAVAWKLALPPPRRRALRDYGVAAWLDDPAATIDAELRGIFESVADRLRRAGASVDDRVRPVADLREVQRNYQRLMWPIVARGLSDEQFIGYVRAAESASPDDSSRDALFARGATVRHRDWLRLDEWRARYRARWAELFRDFDVVLCPIMPTTALPHDHGEPMAARKIVVNGEPRAYWDQLVWAAAITTAYLPATVAPVGRTRSGLPVGLQIVAPYLEDRTSIDFARRLADVAGGFEPPPGF
jgi:amidase